MIRKGRGFNNRRPNKHEWNIVRREVLKRDKYRCQMPGCRRRTKLQIHHVIRYADSTYGRFCSSNAICLCSTHHEEIQDKEHLYMTMFFRIISENEKRYRDENNS